MTTQKPFNVDTIISILNKDIEQEKGYISSFEEIKKHLVKHDGKMFGKRFEKSIPEGMKYVVRAGMFHIEDKEGRSHLIGYASDPFVRADKFDQFDCCHGSAAMERIGQIETILNNPVKLNELASLFISLHETYAKLKDLSMTLETGKFESFHNPSYYDLLRAAGVPSQLMSDIRFGKDLKD